MYSLVFGAKTGICHTHQGLVHCLSYHTKKGLRLASEIKEGEGRYVIDVPALPGFPVTLFGGKGFLRGGMGLGGKGGRRVPGIVARRLYYR